MPGASIRKEAMQELIQDISTARSPDSVIALLKQYELKVMSQLQPGNLHPDDAKEISELMTFEQIFQSVHFHVWESTALPDAFPEMLRSFTEEVSDDSQSDIGIVVEEHADVEGVQKWIKEKLAGISILWEPRTWLDGPVSISVLPISTIHPSLQKLLLQEKRK